MHTKIHFIEAAEKLIREDGIAGVTIRKIATQAGYNSATLYNYFDDLEHLILFASMRHLRAYVRELEKETTRDMNTLEVYRVIYKVFCDYSFRSPTIFHNMFFGRYSAKLNDVLQEYYQLFPDELDNQKSVVKSMLSLGDIYQRDLAIMRALVEEHFVKPEKGNDTVQLIVRTHQSFLADACIRGGQLDIVEHVTKFMELFDYIMEAAK